MGGDHAARRAVDHGAGRACAASFGLPAFLAIRRLVFAGALAGQRPNARAHPGCESYDAFSAAASLSA
jgi:hypothetical protein